MSSEHVEVLRDLSEVCRAAIKAGDWKVDGACDPDSLLRHADAAIASLSAPQPPAEAQPVAWLGANPRTGVPVMAVRTPAPSVMRDFAMRPLYAHPPPSAPVGVEALVGNWKARAETKRAESKNKDWAEWLRENHAGAASAFTTCARELSAALAQQPAADSRICRVCDGGPGNDGSCLCGHRKWEQPAAVDGDDFDCPHSAFDNCDCYADQQGGES